MRAWLARHWFLVLLCLGVVVAVAWTEVVRAAVEPIPVAAVVPATLFLSSWTLESRRLWQAVVSPGPVLLAAAVSYGLIPAVASLLSRLFVSADLQLGLLVAASVPCTLVSAVIWTRQADGDDAVALLVTFVTTATSWFVTPAWLLLSTGAVVPIDAASMMLRLFLFLVTPVALGQLARWPAPLRLFATRGKPSLSALAQLFVFLIIVQSVVLAADRLRKTDSAGVDLLIGVAAVCLALHLLGLAVGFWTATGLRLGRPRAIAVAFSGSQKTLPVGVLLIDAYFRTMPLAVVPLLFYHVGQLLVDTFIAGRFRARGEEASNAAPRKTSPTGADSV